MTTRGMTGLAWLTGLALATTGGMVACNKPAQATDLSRDLDAAASPSPLTLAPTSGRRDVISTVEQAPEARRAPRPSAPQLRPVAHRAPERAAVTPAPVPPTPVAAAPAPVPQPEQPARTTRRPTPVQQAPPGGYKTEGEVIRNAPFPILP